MSNRIEQGNHQTHQIDLEGHLFGAPKTASRRGVFGKVAGAARDIVSELTAQPRPEDKIQGTILEPIVDRRGAIKWIAGVGLGLAGAAGYSIWRVTSRLDYPSGTIPVPADLRAAPAAPDFVTSDEIEQERQVILGYIDRGIPHQFDREGKSLRELAQGYELIYDVQPMNPQKHGSVNIDQLNTRVYPWTGNDKTILQDQEKVFNDPMNWSYELSMVKIGKDGEIVEERWTVQKQSRGKLGMYTFNAIERTRNNIREIYIRENKPAVV